MLWPLMMRKAQCAPKFLGLFMPLVLGAARTRHHILMENKVFFEISDLDSALF
jgi:hypothetical protein